MFILIVKIILLLSIAGMAVIISRALPRLAVLEAKKTGEGKNFYNAAKKIFSEVKGSAIKSKDFVAKNIVSIKNSSVKNMKNEPSKLSSDYWEKIRKSR